MEEKTSGQEQKQDLSPDSDNDPEEEPTALIGHPNFYSGLDLDIENLKEIFGPDFSRLSFTRVTYDEVDRNREYRERVFFSSQDFRELVKLSEPFIKFTTQQRWPLNIELEVSEALDKLVQKAEINLGWQD